MPVTPWARWMGDAAQLRGGLCISRGLPVRGGALSMVLKRKIVLIYRLARRQVLAENVN